MPSTTPKMIFHAPYPLDPTRVAASAIRPVKMLQAFRNVGYDVFEITGNGAERARAVRQLRRRIALGDRFEFLYSENATIPPMLTDKYHVPAHPLTDAALFRLCAGHGIPSGVFYRDLYWKFPEYEQQVGRAVATVMKQLYRAELALYNRWGTTVFLPSLRMAKHLPELTAVTVAALPPGTVIPDVAAKTPAAGQLRILYVGGLGDHYRFHNLVSAVAAVDGVELTICTREALWEAHRHEYPEADVCDRIHVVHEQGEGLRALYAQTDVCSLAMEAHPYRDFAAPFKFYEYIGYGKPILATAGALTGDEVTKADLGWMTDNSIAQLCELLTRLRDTPTLVDAAATHCRALRHEHTWEARARQVAKDLTGVAPDLASALTIHPAEGA